MKRSNRSGIAYERFMDATIIVSTNELMVRRAGVLIIRESILGFSSMMPAIRMARQQVKYLNSLKQ